MQENEPKRAGAKIVSGATGIGLGTLLASVIPKLTDDPTINKNLVLIGSSFAIGIDTLVSYVQPPVMKYIMLLIYKFKKSIDTKETNVLVSEVVRVRKILSETNLCDTDRNDFNNRIDSVNRQLVDKEIKSLEDAIKKA